MPAGRDRGWGYVYHIVAVAADAVGAGRAQSSQSASTSTGRSSRAHVGMLLLSTIVRGKTPHLPFDADSAIQVVEIEIRRADRGRVPTSTGTGSAALEAAGAAAGMFRAGACDGADGARRQTLGILALTLLDVSGVNRFAAAPVRIGRSCSCITCSGSSAEGMRVGGRGRVPLVVAEGTYTSGGSANATSTTARSSGSASFLAELLREAIFGRFDDATRPHSSKL